MGFRRRGRRRGPRLRWFTPELWNASSPQVYATEIVGAAAPEFTTATSMARMVYGSAPFAGVVNASGALTGKQLAELQRWRLLRVVGRMVWYLSIDTAIDMSVAGGQVTVWWAFVRWHTEESGQPDTPFPVLATRDDQDEKPVIIAQDVWRTNYPIGTTLEPGVHPLAAEPPLYSLIDKTMRRPFANEQDLFLATQIGIGTNGIAGIPNGLEVNLTGLLNLRVLGNFNR